MVLAGKTILITGSANGMGYHLTKVFADKGAHVIATDVNLKVLEEKTSSLGSENIVPYQLDVSNYENWEEVIDKVMKSFHKIDYLFNIAGVIHPCYIHESDRKRIDMTIDINLKGTIYGTQLVSAIMVAQNEGHIVNFGSLASLAPVPGLNLYSASKFGVRGFSLAIAQELSRHNVFVSVLCPDAVKTPMLDAQIPFKEAALTFSGSKFLTVEDIEKVVFSEILHKKKRDVWVPMDRGITAFLSSIMPGLAQRLEKMLLKKGMKNQEKYRVTH